MRTVRRIINRRRLRIEEISTSTAAKCITHALSCCAQSQAQIFQINLFFEDAMTYLPESIPAARFSVPAGGHRGLEINRHGRYS
jgi:hypothetical protein